MPPVDGRCNPMHDKDELQRMLSITVDTKKVLHPVWKGKKPSNNSRQMKDQPQFKLIQNTLDNLQKHTNT